MQINDLRNGFHKTKRSFPMRSAYLASLSYRFLRHGAIFRIMEIARGKLSGPMVILLRWTINPTSARMVNSPRLKPSPLIWSPSDSCCALNQAVNVAIWPMLFAVLALSARQACHALSPDQARQTFHPLGWDELAEVEMVR